MAWNLIIDADAKDDIGALIDARFAEARDKYPGASRQSMVDAEPRVKIARKQALELVKAFAPQGGKVQVEIGGSDVASEGPAALNVQVRLMGG